MGQERKSPSVIMEEKMELLVKFSNAAGGEIRIFRSKSSNMSTGYQKSPLKCGD